MVESASLACGISPGQGVAVVLVSRRGSPTTGVVATGEHTADRGGTGVTASRRDPRPTIGHTRLAR